MNGIPTLNGGSYDNCGYEEGVTLSVDSRNLKWQAKQNGVSSAAANKSYNFKDYQKYMKKRNDKLDREQSKIDQELIIKQIE